MDGPADEIIAAWAEVALPMVDRRARAREVLRVTLATSLQRLVVNDPLVRADTDPEGVHQARVACRRLRSDLRTFRPLLEPGWPDPLRDELRWLATALGAVRDLDVLRNRIERQAGDLPGVDRDAAAGVLDGLAHQREVALEGARDALASQRYATLLERLADAARAPHLSPRGDERAVEVLPSLVWRAHRRLRTHVAGLAPHPSDEQLHDLRIQTKRARYAADVAGLVVGEPAERYAGAAARLQDVLGELHDCVVAEHRLRAAVEAADPTTGFVLGELAARQREEAAGLRRAWRRPWRKLDRAKRTAWMR